VKSTKNLLEHASSNPLTAVFGSDIYPDRSTHYSSVSGLLCSLFVKMNVVSGDGMIVNAWYEWCCCALGCWCVRCCRKFCENSQCFSMLFVFLTLSHIVFRQRYTCSNAHFKQRPKCHGSVEAVGRQCPRHLSFTTYWCLVSRSQ